MINYLEVEVKVFILNKSQTEKRHAKKTSQLLSRISVGASRLQMRSSFATLERKFRGLNMQYMDYSERFRIKGYLYCLPVFRRSEMIQRFINRSMNNDLNKILATMLQKKYLNALHTKEESSRFQWRNSSV